MNQKHTKYNCFNQEVNISQFCRVLEWTVSTLVFHSVINNDLYSYMTTRNSFHFKVA